jgi:undecaprenyl-diphosphatase
VNPFRRLTSLWRDSIRVDARLLLTFLAICLGLFVFGKLASEVMEGDSMALDHGIISALRVPGNPETPIGPRWFLLCVRDITALGGWTVLTLLTIAVAGFLMVARRRATALFVVFAIAGGATLSTILKSLFNRPRPDVVAHLVDVHSTSFPSGHAMNSAIVYLTLGALLARTQQVRVLRIYLLSVSIVLALMIGASRVYLGVHWPSDVLAGWMVGASWAVLCSLLARRLQQSHTLEPGTTPKVQ